MRDGRTEKGGGIFSRVFGGFPRTNSLDIVEALSSDGGGSEGGGGGGGGHGFAAMEPMGVEPSIMSRVVEEDGEDGEEEGSTGTKGWGCCCWNSCCCCCCCCC